MGISSMWASNQWNRWNRFDFNEDSNVTPDRKLKRSKKYHKRIFALSCIFFRYQEEGRKYGIELVEKENFEGSRLIVTSLSRLIIRETNSNDTGGFFFKTPCLEIICCSGWYNCTQTASQPPQNQSHYLEVKGLTHSHQNFSQSPASLWSPESWIQDTPTQKRTWSTGSHVLSEMPRLGNNPLLSHHWRENCSQIRWTKGNESKTFSDNPDLRINTRKVKVFNFDTEDTAGKFYSKLEIMGIKSSGQWNLCLSCWSPQEDCGSHCSV